MSELHAFLNAITIVLCVAAVTTVVFQRLHQPVVIGYIIAGLLVGPYVPFPLVADPNIIRTLSELGVIMLMFSLGLEFSIHKLIKVGSTAGIIAVLETSIMIWLGFTIGRSFGWTTVESLFTGVIIAISSTTIIAKVFAEQNIKGRLHEIVVGILIVEDLIGILFMAMFTGIASGSGLSAGPLAVTIGKLTAFLIGLIGIGLFLVPRMMRTILKINRKETTLVVSIGFCFVVSLIANAFGYSVALGAFLAGSLIAQSGEEKRVEHLIEPVRDMFAAIFFVSVGMMIDPAVVWRYLPAILVLTAAVITGKIFGVSLGSFMTGNGMRTSIKTGMSMAQIGEFSFIIAGLGLSLRATGDFLYPIAVTISAITTLSTPILIRNSGPFASFIDRKLPKPLQTFTTLYGSWIEELRDRSEKKKTSAPIRRLLRRLLVDAVLLGGIIIGTSVSLSSAVVFLQQHVPFSPTVIKVILILIAAALSAPFCVGIVRVGKKLGIFLARMALPAKKDGGVDFVAAPRKMLVVTLQLASILLVGIPLLALTQPFLPSIPAAAIFVISLTGLAIIFWQSATDLQGHVRAGAEVIAEALNIQSKSTGNIREDETLKLKEIHQLLPGLGDLVAVKLEPGNPSIGKTLAVLNLRGVTGASVLAINRGSTGMIIPTAEERLRESDVLALSGSHEAVASAKEYLQTAVLPSADEKNDGQPNGDEL